VPSAMKPIRYLGLLVLALSACSSKKAKSEEAPAGGAVKIDGSSTVMLISEAVAEEFGNAGLGEATVAESGTGGGLQKFCRGEIDIANASRPIKATETEACKAAGIEFIELPIAYDGLAVVVNPALDFVDHLTVAELKKMWEPEADGKITSWSQIRAGWPDKALHLYGPGTDSGTYDYFTQAVVGKEHSSRADFTGNEDDNVLVEGVAGDGGGLGYFGYAYYDANKAKLEVVAIDGGNGPVLPALQTVADGTYQPLSRPLFIYVSVKAAARPSVVSFVEYYLQEAKGLVEEVKYIPLPDAAYDLVKKRFADRKTGSAFSGGSQVGVTIEKLLASEGT
jgi:phosphate transport system substrate-binding protein